MVKEINDLFSIEGQTVFLSGGAGYLGRVMGSAILSAGARLIAIGRSDQIFKQGKEWEDTFGVDQVRAEQVDMYDLPILEKLLKQLSKEEDVSILINNAHELSSTTGFNDDSGRLETAGFDGWMKNMTAGAYWPALTTRVFGENMKAKGGGSVINISSMYSLVAPNPRLYEGTNFINPPGYSASKAAMLALTRYTASFWGSYNIRANAIVPGPFPNTQNKGPNSVKDTDPFIQRLSNQTCLGRPGKPEELIGPILFLASAASSYVTGHTMAIDGGWTII